MAVRGWVCSLFRVRIFISWSKDPSKAVARALRDWLPDVIQSVEPWMSTADIGAGARWSNDVAQALAESKIGIICVTPQNQTEPWLNFEAGALAKTLEGTFVCPYLINMRTSDLRGGPLTQFQAKTADAKGTWELIETINRASGDVQLPDGRLRRLFDRAWPDLEKTLRALPPTPTAPTHRPAEEVLEEVLVTVRGISREMNDSRPDTALLEEVHGNVRDISRELRGFLSAIDLQVHNFRSDEPSAPPAAPVVPRRPRPYTLPFFPTEAPAPARPAAPSPGNARRAPAGSARQRVPPPATNTDTTGGDPDAGGNPDAGGDPGAPDAGDE